MLRVSFSPAPECVVADCWNRAFPPPPCHQRLLLLLLCYTRLHKRLRRERVFCKAIYTTLKYVGLCWATHILFVFRYRKPRYIKAISNDGRTTDERRTNDDDERRTNDDDERRRRTTTTNDDDERRRRTTTTNDDDERRRRTTDERRTNDGRTTDERRTNDGRNIRHWDTNSIRNLFQP